MLALALLLYAPAAHAQTPADSIAAPPGIEVVNSSTLKSEKQARADSAKAHGWSAQPRFVMARSLLIPGWGQVYNHAWYKAGAVAAGEVYLGVRVLQDERKLDDLQAQLDDAKADGDADRAEQLANEYNDQLDQRIAKQWLLAAVITYAMVDAYVDAHFRGFELEFKHDPALPDGPPPAHPDAGSGGGTGVRMGFRWHF